MSRIVALGAAAVLLATPLSARAQDDDPGYKPGPWHYRSVACTDTTVRGVLPRLVGGSQTTFTKADFDSGVDVEFNARVGPDKQKAEVVHYQGTVGNNIMMAERPGDKVQVCFISSPAPTMYCDPDQDGRGRVYRVYDYRQRAQYWGQNSEHGCGGA